MRLPKSFLIILLTVISLSSCKKEIDYGDFELGRENVVRFDIDVNTNIDKNSSPNFEKDKAVLILPLKYSLGANALKTRLVIYCHSGGGTVSDNGSEAEESLFCKYLVSQGYAILSVAGMPESYSRRMKIDHYRTVGSPISLLAAEEAYKEVINKYNIYDNGCFVISNSNGGLQAGNIVNLSKVIPVIAQAGLAPLISTEKNAWQIASASLSGGEFARYQIRANIIRIFGMKDVKTVTELTNAKYEKNLVGIYDPYDYAINQTKEKYPVPYLIYAMKNDQLISYSLISTFQEMLNSRGYNIYIGNTEEFGAHNVTMNPIYVGIFTYMRRDYNLNLTIQQTLDFFISHEKNFK